MKAGNNISVRQLLHAENMAGIDKSHLSELLSEYPYMAHLQWINAFLYKENNDGRETKAGVYAFYPRILQYSIEQESFLYEKKIEKITEDSEREEVNEKPAVAEKAEEDEAIVAEETETAQKDGSTTDQPKEEGISQEESLPSEETNIDQRENPNVLQGVLAGSEDDREKENSEKERGEDSSSEKQSQPSEPQSKEEEKRTPAPATTPVSAVQPLYTEDYFAYTQTKLPEDLQDDKPPTMDQVNSFTGWLRKMKRPQALPEKEPVGEEPPSKEAEVKKEVIPEERKGKESEENEESETAEDRIDSKDDNSLKNNEVITESMAEIWEQYGDLNKAEDVYRKLILLNPEKKTYFAAKIKALKEQ